ncbi:hypothetical protein KQ941_03030 [Paenibacillus xylanexedens]|uniref:hypothetical protein n=1 Tax=Paenibacillus xylanexedens TaxID=528191 RepID=UPI001F1B4516|nr:hypothetical protein [Paenibacillus xylanexedens]MCF7753403.1 hypothetical protein [Paenibacillus xylanexedens]
MIRTVTFKRSFHFGGSEEEAVVLRRCEASSTIDLSFPFQEDTPNIELGIAQAMDLRNALNDLIGEVLALPAPVTELFPSTRVSVADQSEFSALFDRFPSDSEGDKQARKALTLASGVLGLPLGAYMR